MKTSPTRLLSGLVAGALASLAGGALAHGASAHVDQPAAKIQPAAIQLAPLAVGQTRSIEFDAAQLQSLKPNQAFTLSLGELGKLPLIFEHATATVNGVSYWEAHLDGDLQQRVSLKIDNGAVSGTILLKQHKLVLGHANGQSFVTRYGNDYRPRQLQANSTAIFNSAAVGKKQPRSYPGDKPAKASWPVSINFEQLKTAELNSEVALNLPDGRKLAIVHDKAEMSEAGNYTFIGYVRDQGTNHRVVLTAGADGNAYGVINLPSGEIRLESSGGNQWLVDVKQSGLTYAPLAEPLQPPPSGDEGSMGQAQALAAKAMAAPANGKKAAGSETAQAPVAMAAAGDTVVDLMVLYSPYMVSRLGGDGAARARVDNLVAVTNQIMVDSQIAVRVRLVHARQVNQADNVNQGDLLTALANDSGAFAGVRALRDQYGADLVEFIHKPTVGVGSCGIGYLSVGQGPRGNAGAGFTVVDDSCPTMVMAHELGHNFGNNHDHAQGGGTPVYPYSWGYIVPGTNYGDVMSYAGTHYYKFSNPRIGGCAGQACGATNWADSAQSMNNVREIVAGYRPTKVSGGGSEVVLNPGQGINSPNGAYTFIYQTDGNLVLYAGGRPLWASGTWGRGVGRTVMQGDGNLVVYNGSGQPLWASGTWGNPGSTLAVQDDGNVVIYRADHAPIWATNTVQRSGFSGNGRYQIQNVHSGKCVDVAWAATNDGANIQQANCSGNAAQLFDVVDMGGGWYRLANVNSGKVMDVAGNSTADGANIHQWSNNGTGAQRFAIRAAGNGEFTLVNQTSGKCADVAGWSTADGGDIIQWSCHGGANQKYRFLPR